MSNFSFLEKQFPLLAELGEKAEQYLYTDPNTTMCKLRSFLARAFRGELGTQNPSDPSALELLKECVLAGKEISKS